MNTTLLQILSRYSTTSVGPSGMVQTSIEGLSVARAHGPGGLEYAISRPLICLVIQGSKRVISGRDIVSFTAGDSLLITADVPTVSQITEASATAPYLSLVLELDPVVITELILEMKLTPLERKVTVLAEPTDKDVAEAALRLMRLLDRPAALPVLGKPLLREMHYWLLAGKHGGAIRQMGWPEAYAQQIAAAVSVLRAEFAQPLPVEQLAAVAGMSPSSFHYHFRAVTSLSPRQFQKHLRLTEARRRMVASGISASNAAFSVGYESVQQFTREYRRLFGLPPGKDMEALKEEARDSEAKADNAGGLPV